MNYYNTILGNVKAPPRRTFFSFHYQKDVSRAHVVRNSWVTKDEREEAGFFDASVFESKKRVSEDALKSFLTDALNGTSVTCVLIGEDTYARPWVRYELVRSFEQGKGLFGIRVHGLKDLQQRFGTAGLNPFDCLAYRVEKDRVYWQELNGTTWQGYDRVPSMKLSDVAYNLQGRNHHTFSHLFPIYDWVADSGYNNIKNWVQAAATHAGK